MLGLFDAQMPSTLPVQLSTYPVSSPTTVTLTKLVNLVWNTAVGTVTINKNCTFRWNVGYNTVWTKIN